MTKENSVHQIKLKNIFTFYKTTECHLILSTAKLGESSRNIIDPFKFFL